MADDLIERMKEALERHKDDYARTNDYMDATFSLGADAADLLPEAIKEIEELRASAEAAEAKLAVAVGALEDALNRMEEDRASGDCGNWDWVDGDVYSRGRATLAEIKGECDAD